MGTCGVLGLIIAGKRHPTYCNYDVYPGGLGQDVVQFILSLKPQEYDEMARLVREIHWVTETDPIPEEMMKKYCALGYNMFLGSDNREYGWYGLLRAMQGAPALYAIWKGDLKHLVLSDTDNDGTNHSGWSFFLDFEKKQLEVWHEVLVDTVSFENLRELGFKYMKRVGMVDSVEDE